MEETKEFKIALENGLDLEKLCTTGSVLNIHEDYNENDYDDETDDNKIKTDYIGTPIKSFAILDKQMTAIDSNGYVKKKIISEGGGYELNDGCTVSFAFTGYWENEPEPFDVRKPSKPMVVDLKDNGLLPGLLIAIKSMLVGETSLFLLSHQLMYGDLGVPPRIKPKAKCAFYINLIKCILTPAEGNLDLSEPNSFARVSKEVKLLYASGITLHKSNNYMAAIKLFKKGVHMLHSCRLANEEEEKFQRQLLIKLYTNLSICYNIAKLPLKTCTMCNELNRLDSLWNKSKVLFQNAKALRMIGQFDEAEKKLKRAMKLSPNNEELTNELAVLQKTRENCNKRKLLINYEGQMSNVVNDNFKIEVDHLIKYFKENDNLCKYTLPSGLNSEEVNYVKEACERENIYFNKVETNYLLDREDESSIVDDWNIVC
ncbi:inactive peptidyl-prolyl cis-trans isomerase shutdown-like isoform X1 [Leptidea sinapis]|uniref:inactive peptidyl-prolyl cis-trans isomerase shutdown-like isoform X1 n=2 Tax=Leptidea sinapis TaxID=189913 RepID=UPI002121E257|nr:inactive peptidyl-prolyl cis-trans isomerase shutdown-like isoform X1 [Leptidea sinapis]XP_050685538.1 inactive peptidyl-prolyl cis-trans isomerase shutdown-like isoform X1 [Leptidea sinapis]